MSYNKMLLLAVSLTLVSGQRPSFAGSRPIGYPEVIKPTTEAGLGNRFGEDDVPTTTIRLPVEANGDRDLIDRLSKLPIDQQPFWYINWQAYEAHRQNPQTYPLKPNVFGNPDQTAGLSQSTNFNQMPSNVNQMPNNFNQMPSNVNQMPSNVNQMPNNFNQMPSNVNQMPNNFNRPPTQGQMNVNQPQMGFNRPPSQGQMNFNRPPMNFNQPPTNNQASTFNQASNGLGNRFSDMDLVQAQTTQKTLSLEELYNSQRIKPVTNADGTTSWQIVDKNVVEALEKIQNKEQAKA